MDTKKTVDLYCSNCIYWGNYLDSDEPDGFGKRPCRMVALMTGEDDYCSFGKAEQHKK